MYLSDMHTHSIASGHGTSCTISDMAKSASRKGLKLLGITDHGQLLLQQEPRLISAVLLIRRGSVLMWNYYMGLN